MDPEPRLPRTRPPRASRATSFGAAAEQYDRTRPVPPDAALDWLLRGEEHHVLDLGAGTGQISRRVAARGVPDVVAVEPDAAMRRVLASRSPVVRVLAGTAEEIPLAADSVDAVLVGSAWHWFDHDRALSEIARVLRPAGRLGVVATSPDISVDWVAAMYGPLAPDHRETTRRHYDEVDLDVGVFAAVQTLDLRYGQTMTSGQVRALFATSSHHLTATDPERADLDALVRETLARRFPDGDVDLPVHARCWRSHLCRTTHSAEAEPPRRAARVGVATSGLRQGSHRRRRGEPHPSPRDAVMTSKPGSSTVPPVVPEPLAVRMTHLLGGFMISQALYAAARLDVLTQLDNGPLSITELAARTGADPDALRRLVRALAPEGVFSTDGEIVAVTPLGAMLSRNHPESLYELACFWMETSYLPYSEFTHTLRTGEPGATRYLGQRYADWVTADPERAAQLGRTFAAIGAGLRPGFFADYELPEGAVIADIGGADGSNLIELLVRHPDRRGIVLDRPVVVPEAQARVSRAGLSDRVDVVAGDFFVEVPAADVYLLSTVLHDWDDAACGRILASIASAARPGASLVLVEGLVAAGDVPDPTKLSDLVMLGIAGGRERTGDEFAALLGAAGFTVGAVIRSNGPYSIIEARSA